MAHGHGLPPTAGEPDWVEGGARDAVWARLEPLLDELLGLEDVEREARLAALATTDAHLAARVRDLLWRAQSDGPPWRPLAELVGPLLTQDAIAFDAARTGERVGPFRLGEELGRGGMGVVYAGERVEGGFAQQVAVKVTKRGVDTDEVLRRFVDERRILARLEHPNIARLVDGGVTADGLPWFAMERVDGQPITRYADERGLGLRERLGLFLDVCSAVGFAHERLVVHRDIKPGNVLVDGAGRVKLLDFGIAKLLDRGEPGLTRTVTQLMTPRYAAPEQREGGEVTPRTDVWQLGALLAEMLPAAAPRDLARIVARARDDEPVRRYVSAAALADDVRCFLAGRPVAARGRGALYRLGRLLRRHRFAAAALAVALAAVGAVAIVLQRPGNREVAAPAASGFALLSTGGSSQWQPALSPDGTALAFAAADDHGVAQVWRQPIAGGTPVALTSGAVPVARPRWSADGRIVFERRGQGIWSVPEVGGAPTRLVESGSNPNLSRDGRWLVWERRGEGVWVARSDGTEARRVAALPESFYVNWRDRLPALSPDGREVVYFLAVAGPFGDYWRVPVDGGAPKRLTFDLADGGAAAWAPDGRSVIAPSSRDGSLTLWRVPLDGGPPRPLTIGAGDDSWPEVSADGARLVYTSARNAHVIRIHDPRTGRDREVLSQRTLLLGRALVSPAGDQIAFYGGPRNGESRLFTVRTDGGGLRQVTHGEGVDHVQPQWSADGRTLFFQEDRPADWRVAADGAVTYAAGARPSLRAVPAAGGADREVLRDWVAEDRLWTQVDPTGTRLVYTLAIDGSPAATFVRDLRSGMEQELPRPLHAARWSADGSRLLAVTPDTAGVTPNASGRVVNCRADGAGCLGLGMAQVAYWYAGGREVLLGTQVAPFDDPELVALDLTAVPATGGAQRFVARLGPLRRTAAGVSVAPDGAIAWIAYEAGRRELWSARLESSQGR
jgi:Tol biopolymer transport system component